MPYAYAKVVDVIQSQRRFVHYTSSDVAMSIIRNKQVWMRSTMTMNDFQEIEHGLGCLAQAFSSPDVGQEMKDLLESRHPGLHQKLADTFDSWLGHFRADTYITCLSEHDASEDQNGRLSMWRAYGGRNGVALVINNTPFVASTDALKAYSSPVNYLTADGFKTEFAKVVQNMVDHPDVLDALGEEGLFAYLFTAFRYAVICTKHPGFAEEREWRVVYAPTMEKSNVIDSSVESVGGVAQIVQKLPLLNDPDNGLHAADIPNLLDRLIIGPCQYPLATYKAFVRILEEAGVADAPTKVILSEIPLRQ